MKIILAFVFLFLFQNSNAIRCYECNGAIDSSCSFESFDASRYTPVNCNSPSVSCLKGYAPGKFIQYWYLVITSMCKYIFIIGTNIPFRSCGLVLQVVDGRNGCLFENVNGVKYIACECTGDLCNSAVKNSIQITTALIGLLGCFIQNLLK